MHRSPADDEPTEDRAVQGEATEDRAVQDEATEDRAVQDEATEDRAVQGEATEDRAPVSEEPSSEAPERTEPEGERTEETEPVGEESVETREEAVEATRDTESAHDRTEFQVEGTPPSEPAESPRPDPEPEAVKPAVAVAEAEAPAPVAEVEDADGEVVDEAEGEEEEEGGSGFFFTFGEWYVVHTYAGYENKVKTNLGSRIQSMNMEDKIYEVVVPTEEVMELKAGKMQAVQKKVFPGYILVRMDLDDDSWYVVRNTPGVTGFVGPTGAKPLPLDESEVEKILAPKAEDRPRPQLQYELGEVVSVTGGAFAGYSGPVATIDVDRQRVTVLLDLFGRETPVELTFEQVTKL